MNNEKYDLNGKTALITGASGLLGIEHAQALLNSRARVILTDINLENTSPFELLSPVSFLNLFELINLLPQYP